MKLCGTEEKCRNYADVVFKGGLKMCSLKREFRYYQYTFGEYVESVTKSLLV